MSVSFEISSSIKSYQVEIVTNLLEGGKYQPKYDFVLVDQLVLGLYPYLMSEKLISIPAIEESKSLETVAYVVENLRSLGANRNSHLIAVGGGIIQDIATFTASIFMRGITWSYYPTTLLGMVDSCVGGKSSINVGQYKNIAGNFYPPEKIIVDTKFCGTLQYAELISGLCEAVKICFADQGSPFDTYLKLTDQNGLVPEVNLAKVIALTLATKKKFIEADEFDTGIRLLLNFGHTFGHAIEAAGNFSITHGVAVGLGMQIAIHLASQLDSNVKENTRVRLLGDYLARLLNGVPHLADNLKAIPAEAMFSKFQSDKKHTSNEYVIIVPDEKGFLMRKFVNKSEAFELLLSNSFEAVKGLYEV
jgi:3-dehydroquinate synthase